MSRAAAEKREAADSFRATLSAATEKGASAVERRMLEASDATDGAIANAGRAMLEPFGKTSTEIAQLGTDMSATVGSKLNDRVTELTRQFEYLVVAVTAE